MRKLKIIIPLLALFVFLIAAGAITRARSAQPIAADSLDAQKQKVLMAVSQKDPAKTTAALDQMILRYSRNKDLPQALYDLGCDSRDINKDDSILIHHYNIVMFQENIYAMQSQLEIFNIHYDSGDIEAADTDIQSLIENFSSQPALPKELYKIAGKYNYAGKRTKANEIYAAASQYSPDDMYVQLSQIFCDITKDDSVSVYSNLTSLTEEHFDDSQLAEEIYNTAVNCGYADQHQYAIQFYQQLLETWPDANQAPYATQRMAIEYSKLGDEANADIAIEKLKNDYGDFPDKAETFWKLGQYYRMDADMYDKASGLYEFGANNSPKEDDHTMFCQIELVKYFIRTGDLDTGDEQYEKLTDEFAENPWLASSICFIGDVYLRVGDIDTAETLYADVLAKWPDDPQSIFAVAGLAKVAAQLGNDSQVYELVDDILADYSDHPDIGDAIFGIAEHYWKMALAESKQADNNLKNFYYANARTIWETLINNFPESSAVPESAYFSAEVCRYLGEDQRAIEGYQYVVDNFPDYIYAAIAQSKTIKMYKKFKFDGLMTKSEADQMILAGYKKMIEKFPDHSLAERAERQLKHYVLIDNPKMRFVNMTQKETADYNEAQLGEGGAK